MTSPWSDASLGALVKRQTVVSADGSRLVFTLPGVDFEDFYKFGDVSAWKVMKYFTMMRMLAACRTGFCMNEALDDEHSFFIVKSDVTITQSFYDYAKAGRMWTPVHLSLELDSCGRSTFNTRGCIHDAEEKVQRNLLVSASFTSVRVNMRTRRKSPLPDTFIKRYSKFIVVNSNPLDRHNPTLEAQSASTAKSVQTDVGVGAVHAIPDLRQSSPMDMLSYDHLIVRPSDCDFNKHTTNFAYVRYCLESATLLASGSRREVTSSFDICALRVKRMVSRYVRESLLGDLIRVTTRPDGRCARTLHFGLSRNSDLLFEMTVEFYDSVADSIRWRDDVHNIAKL